MTSMALRFWWLYKDVIRRWEWEMSDMTTYPAWRSFLLSRQSGTCWGSSVCWARLPTGQPRFLYNNITITRFILAKIDKFQKKCLTYRLPGNNRRLLYLGVHHVPELAARGTLHTLLLSERRHWNISNLTFLETEYTFFWSVVFDLFFMAQCAYFKVEIWFEHTYRKVKKSNECNIF